MGAEGHTRACTWCRVIVRTVVRQVEWKHFLVLAPRLRVTSRRTLVVLCTMCLRWCHEWEASHSPLLGDATKIYALYACIHWKLWYIIVVSLILDWSEGVVPSGATHEYTVRLCKVLTLTLHCACA